MYKKRITEWHLWKYKKQHEKVARAADSHAASVSKTSVQFLSTSKVHCVRRRRVMHHTQCVPSLASGISRYSLELSLQPARLEVFQTLCDVPSELEDSRVWGTFLLYAQQYYQWPVKRTMRKAPLFQNQKEMTHPQDSLAAAVRESQGPLSCLAYRICFASNLLESGNLTAGYRVFDGITYEVEELLSDLHPAHFSGIIDLSICIDQSSRHTLSDALYDLVTMTATHLFGTAHPITASLMLLRRVTDRGAKFAMWQSLLDWHRKVIGALDPGYLAGIAGRFYTLSYLGSTSEATARLEADITALNGYVETQNRLQSMLSLSRGDLLGLQQCDRSSRDITKEFLQQSGASESDIRTSLLSNTACTMSVCVKTFTAEQGSEEAASACKELLEFAIRVFGNWTRNAWCDVPDFAALVASLAGPTWDRL